MKYDRCGRCRCSQTDKLITEELLRDTTWNMLTSPWGHVVVVGEEVRASEYDVEECKIRRSCSCVVLLRRNKYILPSGSETFV